MGRKGSRRAVRAAVVLAALVLAAACSSGDDGAEPAGDDPTTTSTTTAPIAVGEWEQVDADEPCRCSDGSPFSFWVREADPTKVVFFLAGGGACFSAETCAGAAPTYTVNLTGAGAPGDTGIFDATDPENPLADHTIVFVPYCTGDLHLGTATHDYGGGVEIDHVGSLNATAALDAAAERFPDATQVVVAGSSAGSAGAPVYGGLAHDRWAEADIAVVADASAAYPGTPEITLAIGSLWGTTAGLPDWPETADVPVEEWSLPGLFVQASRHHPELRFATFNDAYDQVQASFSSLIGVDPTNLVDLIDANNEAIRAQDVDLVTWVSPGTEHTILGTDLVFSEEVDGVRFVEWLGAFLAGEAPPDVHCVECAPPTG